MPTPSEQKALTFVAIVILLGGAVRVLRAGGSELPTAVEQHALARQASAADSAARAKSEKKPSKAKRVVIRDTATRVWGGFPPPGPRIDTDAGGQRAAPPSPGRRAEPPKSARIDLDVATAAEIEKLPRIGPALAKRIVANRDSLGPFRNLETLRRVRGMGPATLELVSELVVFSGRPAAKSTPR